MAKFINRIHYRLQRILKTSIDQKEHSHIVEHKNKNCICLITGKEGPGRAWGESERTDLMIDTANGSLFMRCFTIDLGMHGSCIDIDIQWSSLDSLISRFGDTRLRGLSQDNWEEWLIENKYV